MLFSLLGFKDRFYSVFWISIRFTNKYPGGDATYIRLQICECIYKQAVPHIPTSHTMVTYLGNYSSEEPIQHNMNLQGGRTM